MSLWCTVIMIPLASNRQAWKCIARGTRQHCDREAQRTDVTMLTLPTQVSFAKVIVMPADEWAKIVKDQKVRPWPFAL